MLAASDHPFSDLRVNPQEWLGPTVVSGESQVLQGRLGISLILLIAIAWYRQIRRDSEPTPVSKINADLIEEDLRKGREKKAAESGRSDYAHRSVGDRDWNPLGIPKDQWWALSAEERAAAYKKYFGQNKEEPTRQQPHVRYGPRGGRFTEETTSDGRRYRRYF